MATFDDLDAPQFSTFDDADIEEVETYFQVDHESNYQQNKKPVSTEHSCDEEFFYSPMPRNPTPPAPSSTIGVLELRSRRIRRSLSSGDMQAPMKKLEEALKNTHLNAETSNKQNPQVKKNENFEYGKLRKIKSSSQSRLKWSSQENLNRLAAPKNIHTSTGNLAQSSNEYISVAEAVKKFQEQTPTRFHSRNKKQMTLERSDFIRLKATIPHSPRLLTKKRAKHVPVMSQEEREKLEFEEAQKFKIKAHPVNKKIFQQPLKAVHTERKPVTCPEPFKLTEHKKSAPSPKKEVYRFHAKPVPKSVLEPPKVLEKHIKVTQPITPSFIKHIPKASPVKKPLVRQSSLPLKNTMPEPFSFEKRDQKLQQKKEELIKKVTEQEKKAREFHARPIPKPIVSMINEQKQKMLNGSSTSSNHSNLRTSNDDLREEHFKARPPTVLYQKPFEPKKLDHTLTEIQPFQLHSEIRSKEREQFERKKREQNELTAQVLKREEEERIKREQEQLKMLRKEITFKAHPVRNFKEIVIKPSGKITEPVSPVFRSGKSNKENICQQ